MNREFKKHCVPLIKKCRTAKTKNERRANLQKTFFGQYVVKSRIYNDDQIQTVDMSERSEKERRDYERLAKIQGGSYSTQVTTGLYLES